MSLARGQFHLIALAMVFLFIASSAGILLPNYQGAILDRVIQVNGTNSLADFLLR